VRKTIFVFYFLLLANSQWLIADEQFIQVPMVIHVHSTISDGKYSLEEIATLAKEKGIKVVIFSDHNLMRWEYGLWPLQNILKKRIEKNSVLRFGAEKYLQEIEKIQKKYPEILLLPGVESAPFYYWSGKHFKHHLTLHNWHKHMLITGLNSVEDYENLPLVSNPNAGMWGLLKSIFLLWPILLVIFGIWPMIKQRTKKIQFGKQVFLVHSRMPKLFGAFFVVIGLLFLANNYPYKYLSYDQYHGDKGVEPYQNLINYVNTKGGVIFWAHPEAPNWEKGQEVDGIAVQTPTYENDLLRSENYTGFAVLYEGYKKVGIPGGIWDQILNQYCRGTKEKPIWAIGELDYKSEGYLGTYLDSIQNILLIPTNLQESKQETQINTNIKEVLDCLRKGKFYVLQKAKDSELVLEKFEIETGEGIALMGEEIRGREPPKIRIKIKNGSKEKSLVKINLIRGGEIIKTFEQNSPRTFAQDSSATYGLDEHRLPTFSQAKVRGKPLEIEYIDRNIPAGKNYYRLDITGPQGEKIISNPIFLAVIRK